MKAMRTISEAALEVLKSAEGTMSIQEVYQDIVAKSLYEFHAQNPLDVVRVELRKHSVGIDYPTASKKKYFVYDETNGRFSALYKKSEKASTASKDKTYLTQVRNLYDSYLKDFKANWTNQATEPSESNRTGIENVIRIYGRKEYRQL